MKCHELLHKQLASIWNLNLSNVSRVLAVVTFKSLLREITNTHKATLLTNVDTVVVADIKEALL